MSARFSPRRMAILFAGVALALALQLWQPGKAQAHPQLVGRWFGTTPPNLNMSFEFACGTYIGDGIWRGTFTIYWANDPISTGDYELRVFRGTEGTLGLRDGVLANPRFGVVDLGTRLLYLKGATYRP
jgi:hypothetical protein